MQERYRLECRWQHQRGIRSLSFLRTPALSPNPSPARGRGEQTSASIVLPPLPSRNPRETPDASGAHFASPLAAPCHSLRNNAMTACRASLLCKACVGHAPRMAP
ncbi:hypothetical protein CBM2605_A260111 [Cupriavidus neocaledonicus]|uniref:Uncharacterized protein n=1 Tax=Cupriavidus neocaledonicus TaxID=1040979 RepID=A0ABY1V1L7_9BURK|nr:hypothetical protein CBM2605_A260111 [Cupriavidus neocaledonicus]